SVIVTVGKGDGEVTANLAGPLVLNGARKLGVQAILDTEQYQTRQPLSPALSLAARQAA
ncbi:MAG: flagellar assembly protein FliW, partial [Chloroflexota bacterium]